MGHAFFTADGGPTPCHSFAGSVSHNIGVSSDFSAIGGGQNYNISNNSAYATIAGGRLKQKETEITELRQTVNELKQLVQAMNHKLNRGAQ